LDELLERLEFFFHFAQPQTRRMEIVELIERLPAFLALHGNEFYVMKRNSAELNKKVDDLENRLLLVEGEHATLMTEHTKKNQLLMFADLFKVYRAYHADSSLLAHGVADDWYELKRTLKQKKQELFQKKITSADYDQYFKKAQDALGYPDIDLLIKLLKDRNDDCHHDIDDPRNQESFLKMCQKETFIAEIWPIAEVFIEFLTKIKFDKFVS
jgi:hypothetical protein